MGKKIAIITLYGLENYGNRLQNYALQKCLESLNCSVETIAVERTNSKAKSFLKRYFRVQNATIHIRNKNERNREKAFRYFTKKHIHTRYIYRADGFIDKNYGDEYDAFVVGSDQVWNPLFWENGDNSCELNNYCLAFTEKKKIAYAASFGIANISMEWLARMAPLIRKFNAVSVRESEGVALAQRMNIDASLVLDPTLLLNTNDWKKIEGNEVNKSRKYSLHYFLGEKPIELKEANGQDVIDLFDEDEPYSYCGPETFLELIDNAETVYTDSFHAAVFSILFETPFAIYKRQHRNQTDMSGRIATLFDAFNIDREYLNNHKVIMPNTYSYRAINNLADKSKMFIREALSI